MAGAVGTGDTALTGSRTRHGRQTIRSNLSTYVDLAVFYSTQW